MFTSDEASNIVESYNNLKEKKKVSAIVFIGGSDLQYGIARMLEILHEMNNPEGVVFAVHNKKEADDLIENMRQTEKQTSACNNE